MSEPSVRRQDHPTSAPPDAAPAGPRRSDGAADHPGGRGPTRAGSRDLAGDRPSKRMLDRAPSERLRTSLPVAAPADGTAARAVALGLVAAAGGTAVHLGAATLLLWTGGLLVVAVTIGILVGLGVARGAVRSLRPRSRRSLAVALALGSIGLAVGLSWAFSGMYLEPLDYLAQVYGLLVPLQLGLAAVGALAGSR